MFSYHYYKPRKVDQTANDNNFSRASENEPVAVSSL